MQQKGISIFLFIGIIVFIAQPLCGQTAKLRKNLLHFDEIKFLPDTGIAAFAKWKITSELLTNQYGYYSWDMDGNLRENEPPWTNDSFITVTSNTPYLMVERGGHSADTGVQAGLGNYKLTLSVTDHYGNVIHSAFVIIDLLHCNTQSPDLQFTFSVVSGVARILYQGNDVTGYSLSLPVLMSETLNLSCLKWPITVENRFYSIDSSVSMENLVYLNRCDSLITSSSILNIPAEQTIQDDTIPIRPYKAVYFNHGLARIDRFKNWMNTNSRINFEENLALYSGRILVHADFYSTDTCILAVSNDGSMSIGSLQFRDPWHIAVDTNQCDFTQEGTFYQLGISSSGYSLGDSTYSGVFLNQDPSVQGNPYYSIRASKFLDTSGTHKWPGTPLEAGESVFTAFSVAPRDTSAFVVTDPLDTAAQYVIAIDSHIPFLYVPARSRSNQ